MRRRLQRREQGLSVMNRNAAQNKALSRVKTNHKRDHSVIAQENNWPKASTNIVTEGVTYSQAAHSNPFQGRSNRRTRREVNSGVFPHASLGNQLPTQPGFTLPGVTIHVTEERGRKGAPRMLAALSSGPSLLQRPESVVRLTRSNFHTPTIREIRSGEDLCQLSPTKSSSDNSGNRWSEVLWHTTAPSCNRGTKSSREKTRVNHQGGHSSTQRNTYSDSFNNTQFNQRNEIGHSSMPLDIFQTPFYGSRQIENIQPHSLMGSNNMNSGYTQGHGFYSNQHERRPREAKVYDTRRSQYHQRNKNRPKPYNPKLEESDFVSDEVEDEQTPPERQIIRQDDELLIHSDKNSGKSRRHSNSSFLRMHYSRNNSKDDTDPDETQDIRIEKRKTEGQKEDPTNRDADRLSNSNVTSIVPVSSFAPATINNNNLPATGNPYQALAQFPALVGQRCAVCQFVTCSSCQSPMCVVCSSSPCSACIAPLCVACSVTSSSTYGCALCIPCTLRAANPITNAAYHARPAYCMPFNSAAPQQTCVPHLNQVPQQVHNIATQPTAPGALFHRQGNGLGINPQPPYHNIINSNDPVPRGRNTSDQPSEDQRCPLVGPDMKCGGAAGGCPGCSMQTQPCEPIYVPPCLPPCPPGYNPCYPQCPVPMPACSSTDTLLNIIMMVVPVMIFYTLVFFALTKLIGINKFSRLAAVSGTTALVYILALQPDDLIVYPTDKPTFRVRPTPYGIACPPPLQSCVRQGR